MSPWVPSFRRIVFLLVATIGLATGAPACAELVLSQVIVDLLPDQPPREDIEAWNNSPERMYLAAEASQIVSPGLPNESRHQERDPTKLGLLVTPARLVLEPGQHRLIRIAAIPDRSESDRVYRVTIKPVVGPISSEQTGLKILVGYDVLVIVRPSNIMPAVSGTRAGKTLTFRNDGNSSVELINGKQCLAGNRDCHELPSKRLYAGATWQQILPADLPVTYEVKAGKRSEERHVE